MQEQTYSDRSTASTSSMVSSADVNGTEVYSRAGEHLGEINHLMIDKQSGHIAYVDLHRFCSGHVLMLGGPLFEGHPPRRGSPR